MRKSVQDTSQLFLLVIFTLYQYTKINLLWFKNLPVYCTFLQFKLISDKRPSSVNFLKLVELKIFLQQIK